MNTVSQCNFIYEANTSVFNHNHIELLEETKVPGSEIPKIAFESVLQKEESNQNKRKYSAEICTEIVNLLKPRTKGRELYQEVDHPIVDPTQPDGKRRANTVQLKQSGTLIRNITFTEDGEIIGEIETLSGFYGPDVTKLLMYDKADLGFSLRMFGKLITDNTTGMATVAKPIHPITYDIVSNPSHKTARVVKFLPESLSEFKTDNQEDFALLNENYDDINPYDTNKTLYDYLDRLIIDSFNNLKPIMFKFK